MPWVYSQLSLNGHLYKMDTSIRRTPGAGPGRFSVSQCFYDSKVADQQHIPSTDTTIPPIRVIIPFKDQVSANVVKRRLTLRPQLKNQDHHSTRVRQQKTQRRP